MAVSYKKLWKLLIDKDMKKCDLERKVGITHYAMEKGDIEVMIRNKADHENTKPYIDQDYYER